MTDVYEIISPKGGQGVTTTAVAVALGLAARTHRVDLLVRPGDGDALGCLGLPTPHNERFTVEYSPRLTVTTELPKWSNMPEVVVTDGEHDHLELVNSTRTRILVVRNCYLALARCVHRDMAGRFDLVVAYLEAGRSLDRGAIVNVLGRCDVAQALNPSVARAVDAGLMGNHHRLGPIVEHVIAHQEGTHA